jgi:hypothetical protein
MADNDSPSETSLQFDKAEYSVPQAAAAICCACKQPIAQTYFTVNDAIVCDQCHGKFGAFAAGGSKFGRAFAATALGLLAGLAGAAVWYAVRRITGYEIGLIAIVVGLMVGVAVRKGSRGRGGWFYQSLAIVLTYSCITAQYMPDIVEAFMQKARETPSAPAQPAGNALAGKSTGKTSGENVPAEKAAAPAAVAPNPGLVKLTLLIALFLAIAFVISLAVPFLGGAQNLIGLLIIGFALYEAWKINKRLPVQVAGPFRLAPPTASEAPGA